MIYTYYTVVARSFSKGCLFHVGPNFQGGGLHIFRVPWELKISRYFWRAVTFGFLATKPKVR